MLLLPVLAGLVSCIPRFLSHLLSWMSSMNPGCTPSHCELLDVAKRAQPWIATRDDRHRHTSPHQIDQR